MDSSDGGGKKEDLLIKMTIDIAIISQFRAKLLKKCLNSINKQTHLPDKVILVLHPKDQASINLITSTNFAVPCHSGANEMSDRILLRSYQSLRSFQDDKTFLINQSAKLVTRFNKLSFIIKFYPKKGYASLRNLALKTSKSDFLYFIDDDCVLDSKAIKFAYNFLLNHKDYAAVQGQSINYDTSFYAQFSQWTNDLWLERLYDKKSKTLKAVDTKNVCFRRKIITEYRFFECFGSEDVDFGLQITQAGGKIGWQPKMRTFHYEQANNLFSYYWKRLRMQKGLARVKKRWGKLPIFYEENLQFKQKVSKLFKQSKYQKSFKYKLIFKLFLLARDLRFLWEKIK